MSHRDVEEPFGERGMDVDHVTVYRWVQTFTPKFIDAARASRHAWAFAGLSTRTYVEVAGRWKGVRETGSTELAATHPPSGRVRRSGDRAGYQAALRRGARRAGTRPDSTSQRTVSAMVCRNGRGSMPSSLRAAESSNRVSRRTIATPSRSAG